MDLSTKTAAIGSSGVLGLIATLILSLLEEDKLAQLYTKILLLSPKVPLVISAIIVILCYYAFYRYFCIRKERANLLENIKEEETTHETEKEKLKESLQIKIKTQQQDFDKEMAKKNEEIRSLNNKIAQNQLQIEHLQGESNRDKSLYQDKIKEKNETIEKLIVEKDKIEKENKRSHKENQNLHKKLNEKEDEVGSLNKKIKSISMFDVDSSQRWDHNVLVIDDDPIVSSNIQRKLKGIGIHVDTALEIPDYRFASDYEIIVSDVFQCAPAEESTSILNTIKKKYPYKFVYAMSIQPAACLGLEIDGKIIQKDEKYEYVKDIVHLVTECSNKLDNIHEHWQNVEHTLRINNTSDNLINNIKSFYYAFVKRMQIYR